MGPQRRHACILRALRQAHEERRCALHAAGRRLCGHAALSESGGGAEWRRQGRRKSRRQDEGNSDRRSSVRARPDPDRRALHPARLFVPGQEPRGVEEPVGPLQPRRHPPWRSRVSATQGRRLSFGTMRHQKSLTTGNPMDVFEAIYSRRSTRGFHQTPVARQTLERILLAAARAPSGKNMQPWRVYVISGQAKDALVNDARETRAREPQREQTKPPEGEYEYNPEPLFDPYGTRRRKLGWDLYSLHGVARGDRVASWEVAGRNFEFFGAPVGMILTMDRKLQAGSFLDCGIFLQTLMLAALT